MSQWAYEMSDEELVKEFMRTCARAGTAGSGLVIDVTGPYVAAEAQYLKGVILSRLAGQTPPFKRGETIEVAVDRVCSYPGRDLKIGEQLEVERIYFEDQKWKIAIKGIENNERVIPPLYPAERFKSLVAPTG
ncbi:MAG: hypothetical protein Q8R55_04310 [Candidatus Taylorbacteria bacterium]|nr:hypothetical protein [Candidatus Taylorbacteria bacterium]